MTLRLRDITTQQHKQFNKKQKNNYSTDKNMPQKHGKSQQTLTQYGRHHKVGYIELK